MLINNQEKDIICPVCKENNLHITSVHTEGTLYPEKVKIKFVCEHGCDVPDYFIVHRKGSTYTEWKLNKH